MRVCVCDNMHAYIRTYMLVGVIWARECVYLYIYTCIHVNINVYIYIRTYIHVCSGRLGPGGRTLTYGKDTGKLLLFINFHTGDILVLMTVMET